MTKSQKTWAIIILGVLLIALVIMLILKFWQIAIIGGAAFIVGYSMGFQHGKGKKAE